MEEIKRVIKLKNEEETKAFGISLGRELNPGDTLALIGDLGTGKTTLTKYIALGLDIDSEISSPTFVIVKTYEGRLTLNHFDVYRLNEEEDDIDEALYQIGFDEYMYSKDVNVIEWADLILDILPDNTKYIYIERGKDEERTYRCTF